MQRGNRIAWLIVVVGLYVAFFGNGGGLVPLIPQQVTDVAIVIVEDKITPQQSLVAAELREHCDKTGLSCVIVDVEATDEHGNRVADRYVNEARDVSPPFVIAFCDTQKLWVIPLPNSADEIIKRLGSV